MTDIEPGLPRSGGDVAVAAVSHRRTAVGGMMAVVGDIRQRAVDYQMILVPYRRTGTCDAVAGIAQRQHLWQRG